MRMPSSLLHPPFVHSDCSGQIPRSTCTPAPPSALLLPPYLFPVSAVQEWGIGVARVMGLRELGSRSLATGRRPCGRYEGFPVLGSPGDVWVPMVVGGCGGEMGVGGGFSHESEHDLAVMVSDFLENGSGGGDSWCSSDSDTGLTDLGVLAEKISLYKHKVDKYESDLSAVVQSLLLSISESNLHFFKNEPCNGSCIRQCLVKLLQCSGYDAALCRSKWQGCDKIPGGDHEYIVVVVDNGVGVSGRLIIDLDFRSHFEIARAVESYEKILQMLPVVYVGSLVRLKLLLPVMAEAAKFSLKQNSMPLPPWRSLPYLQAKWESAYDRIQSTAELKSHAIHPHHKQCMGHLRRLKSTVQFEIEKERLLQPLVNDKAWMKKSEKWKTSLLRF